jgi:hypothetical protein
MMAPRLPIGSRVRITWWPAAAEHLEGVLGMP